jgi:hypothetical protein
MFGNTFLFYFYYLINELGINVLIIDILVGALARLSEATHKNLKMREYSTQRHTEKKNSMASPLEGEGAKKPPGMADVFAQSPFGAQAPRVSPSADSSQVC